MEAIKIVFTRSKDVWLVPMAIGLGIVFWVSESAAHILWMRWIVIGLFMGFSICVQMMVVARRKAEEATIRANAELSQIFDTAADGMRVIDNDFKVIRANHTFSVLSGLGQEDIVGKKCYDVFSGPLCHTVGCPLKRILSSGERIQYDTEKIRKDGSKVPCIVTATPFREPKGAIIGIVEDFKDISDRREFEQELLQSRERMRDLASHLQVVDEEERKHVAREIHDELGQALTALKMDACWLNSRLPTEDHALVERAGVMVEIIDRTIKSVKRITSELRPGLIDHFGLTAAIEWEAEEFSHRTGVRCEYRSDPEDIILDQDRSIAIFRIFQETLTNVTRHAEATNVRVNLKRYRGGIEMRIQDDGKGISEKQLSDPRSYGLIGMNERVHALGGKLKVEGSDGHGTTVEVVIPIET